MARETAPTSQWSEPNPRGAAARVTRFYPTLDEASGVWGWTTIRSQADGAIVLEDGVLGVEEIDEYTMELRAFGIGGSTGPMFAIGN